MIQKELKNNLKYIICDNKSKYSVNILLLVKVGSRHETKNKYGLAHYLEHMLFKCTDRFKKSKDITNIIYKNGGKMNALTSYDVTGYYITINYKYTEIAIDILSDMFYNSKFCDHIKERDVVINENIKNQSNPNSFCEMEMYKMLFKGTDLDHIVCGLNKDIKKFTLKDIRSFYNKYYKPSNCILSVCGRIHKDTEKFIKKYFKKDMKNKTIPKYNLEKDFMTRQNKLNFKSFIKPVDQAQVYIGFPCYNDTDVKHKHIIELIATILGGNMSSRLFVELREKKGLVYSISSSTDLYIDVGMIYIYFGTFNNKVKECVNLVLKELEKIKKKSITKTKLNEYINYIIGNEEMASENNESKNINMSYELLYLKKITDIKDRLKIFKSITTEDIKEVSNIIFDKNKMNISIVADRKINNFIK